MSYTINALAKLANVSVRTLHHYDAIGLLVPERNDKNKYRTYGDAELIRLQQILFFREMEFSLPEIATIIDSPEFDVLHALRDHKAMLLLRRKRTDALIKMVEKTMNKITKQINMKDEELYDAFSKEDVDAYAEEAKQRWGHTEAYKESTLRVSKMTKEEMDAIKAEGEEIAAAMAEVMDKEVSSREVQDVIARHYGYLAHFYTPNPEMYRCIAEMYVADARFTAYYDKYRKGLASFMRDAMIYFADAQIKNRA